MSDIEVTEYALRDLRYFRVYCRFCGRQNMWWEKLKHARDCLFAEAFRQHFEDRHKAARAAEPPSDVAEGRVPEGEGS